VDQRQAESEARSGNLMKANEVLETLNPER
jgi:hypothetical protein